MMKKTALSLILFFSLSGLCFSQTKEIQFRLVLTKNEAQTIAFDSYVDKDGKEILVSKDVLLSNKDIESMSVSKDVSGRYHLLIKFTDIGKNKFHDVTEKNINRQLAVMIGDKILMDSYVRETINTGRTSIPIDSLDEGEELIRSLGLTPSVQYRF